MKKSLLLLLTGASALLANAQWTETTQPNNSFSSENFLLSDGNRLFLACNDEVYVSTDNANTWTTTATATDNDVTGPYYKMNLYQTHLYVISSTGIYHSNDNGNNWNVDTAGTSVGNFDNTNNFEVVNDQLYFTQGRKMYHKAAGTNLPWVVCSNANDFIYGITYHKNKYLAVSINGSLYESADGTTFTLKASSGLPGSIGQDVYSLSNQLQSFNGKLMVNSISDIYTSTDDGATFSKVTMQWPLYIWGGGFLRLAQVAGNRYYVSTHKDSLFYTTDGNSFQSMSDGAGHTTWIRSITSHNGTFYATQFNDKIIKDGSNPGTGIRNIAAVKPLVYPNPASESITLGNISSNALQITILQNDGRLVYEQTIDQPAANQQLQLPSLAKGSYWISISQDNNSYTQSLMIR